MKLHELLESRMGELSSIADDIAAYIVELGGDTTKSIAHALKSKKYANLSTESKTLIATRVKEMLQK